MSTTHTIQTIIEILMVAAIILGFMYEPLLVKWEAKQKEKVLKAFKKRKELRR